MTDKPTPTDAELEALLLDKLPASKHYIRPVIEKMVAAMQAAIDKWGQPAQATEPVAPDFFTVCALYEGGGEAGWLPLPGYSNETEHGVKNLVLEAARKEGYKGTAAGRLLDLGWEIRPVYLTPQPVAREPLTDEQREAIWQECRYDNGGWEVDCWEVIDAVERMHSIKGGPHGTE